MAKNYEMDMTEGSIMKKLILFTAPLVLMGILQVLYSAADMIVAGRFAGANALAAVGSTNSLINLIIALFFGLATGVSVVVANHYGAREYDEVSNAVHTAITVSVIGGIVLGVFGFLFARTFLEWMDSPEDVIAGATLYTRIYFLGLPFLTVYNFGASVLRAIGDTRRPLYFLILSGAVNVALNLVFVISFRMGVAGVAWATVISEGISAVLVIMCLMRSQGCYRFSLSRMCVKWIDLKKMVRVGLPAGVQGALFSISNVLVQASINSFGSTVMAGYSTSNSLENLIYISVNGVSQAALAFTGQNMGAMKYDHIPKVAKYSNVLVSAAAIITGAVIIAFREPLLALYNSDPDVIAYGSTKLIWIGSMYALCGIMEVMTGVLRGMGRSLSPTVVTIMGACVLRIVWLATVFKHYGTLESIYIVYPVSWAVTSFVQWLCYRSALRKLMPKARDVISAS